MIRSPAPLPAAPLIAALALIALAAGAAATPTRFRSPDRRIAIDAPAGVAAGRDFSGRSLLRGGWRTMWDDTPIGPGTGVVSFDQPARPDRGPGRATESLRIGWSRDPGVVATCGTAGFGGGSGGELARRQPDRHLGGHRWTVWRGSDAGMSQQVAVTSLRTVIDGACYAADRISYVVAAADPPPRDTPARRQAAARIDAALATLTVGGRR